MTLIAGTSAPAATITTTSETVAVNIPAMPVQPPAAAQGIVIRGNITVTTGTATTAVTVKLRVGQNNTTTAQVGIGEPMACGASASFSVPFEFVDLTYGDLASGYTVTVTATAATGNGTVTQAEYDVDLAVP